MNIEVKQDEFGKVNLSMDEENFERLKQGTPFQKGVNLLAMILNETEESAEDFCKSLGIKGKEKEKFLAESRAETLAMLLKTPPRLELIPQH